MDRNWFGNFVELFSFNEGQLRQSLLEFNKSRYNVISARPALNPKSIKRWASQEAPLPNLHTAKFLEVFIEYHGAYIVDKAGVEKFQSELAIRINKGEPQTRKYSDPFSFTAGEVLPHIEVTNQRASEILGFYRLIRYHYVDRELVSELLYVNQKEDGSLSILLLDLQGNLFRGSALLTPNAIHILLVNPKVKNASSQMRMRTLCLETPRNYRTFTVTGVMMRTSTLEELPMSSLVILDKVNKFDSYLKRTKKYFDAYRPLLDYNLNFQIEHPYVGHLDHDQPGYGRYRKALSAKNDEIVAPIRAIGLTEMADLFKDRIVRG